MPVETLAGSFAREFRIETRRAQIFLNAFPVDHDFFSLALGDFERDFPCQTGNISLELAHARFARVARCNFHYRAVGDLDLLRSQAILSNLARQEIAFRNLKFLAIAVTGEPDNVHAIAQRRRNRPQLICRSDKENFREIERQIEIMIRERVVLFRVRISNSRCRIAAIIRSELVDLAQHHHRVVKPARRID
jgi:hypothetical protein